MRRMICVLMVLLPFLVLPALGAELSFPPSLRWTSSSGRRRATG